MMIGKNHEKLLAIIILLIFSFTLTGCYDRREIDDLAYVIALGLDIGQTNELRMTLQLALPIAMGSGAEKAKAEEAVAKVNQHRLSLSKHLQYIPGLI